MEKDNWKKALGENLTALRKKNNITQSELGEKLNYSDKSVSKWERGEGVPDLSVMVQLSELYGVALRLVNVPEVDRVACLTGKL